MAAKLNNEPLVSVIITSYNYGGLIADAIDSVLGQAYRNIELIVVDDGSTDGSLEIIRDYAAKHGNISCYTHPGHENRGLAASLELAVAKVRGEITAFLESDDRWLPDNLSEKVSLLTADSATSAVFSSLELTGESVSGKYTDYVLFLEWAGRKLNRTSAKQYRQVLLRNPAATFSNIVIRTDILKTLAFGSMFEKWLDWQVIIAASLAGNVRYVERKLLQWRIHSRSLHYRHMKDNTAEGLSVQKTAFLANLRSVFNEDAGKSVNKEVADFIGSRNMKTAEAMFNLGFALYHPLVAVRKLLSHYKY